MVFTGSSRDKLANLVLKNGQPFYGARVSEFLRLGRDYVEFVTELWNGSLAAHNQFAIDDVEYAFEIVGRRPEMLTALLSDTHVILGEAGNLGKLLREGALNHQQGIWSNYESPCNDLSALQRAVSEVIAERALRKQPFAPFSSETLEAVNRKLK